MNHLNHPIPLSLYIHTPWCIKKCPYCDFNSHQADSLDEKSYLIQLKNDLKQDIEFFQLPKRELHSIFIGGGTPSLLSAEFYAEIFEFITEHFVIPPQTEITLEANPGASEQQRFKNYRQAGINRLSIGIQSFNDAQLIKLDRVHNSKSAINAIEAAFSAGFENINLDLMYGLPEQTIAEAIDDIKTAISFQTPHLSWYQLTLEPNTWFYHHPPKLPEDDLIAEIEQIGRELLQNAHFENYEISAYAREKKYSVHNLNYWQYGDYLGIGAGAHSKITLEDKTYRYFKTPHPKNYMSNKSFRQKLKEVDPNERLFEFMLNHLRLNQSISLQQMAERISYQADSNSIFSSAETEGLIIIDKNFIYLTDQGKRFRNDLMMAFLPDERKT